MVTEAEREKRRRKRARQRARHSGGASGSGGGAAAGGPAAGAAAGREKAREAPQRKPQGKKRARTATPAAAAAPAPHGKKQKQKQKQPQLLQQMRARLEGARFRMLNEQLYTAPGQESFAAFQREPELFQVYHDGFAEQVSKWPVNPLHLIIAWVRARPELRVADFGCGVAELAASVPNAEVHSFDLVAANERVTACDIAHVPLPDDSVDVVVFCLSLMGTNMADFLREAWRVLVPGGALKIAEVKSRFDSLDAFVGVLGRLGFEVKRRDESNKMFVMLDCVAAPTRPEAAASVEYSAKPCIYKRR